MGLLAGAVGLLAFGTFWFWALLALETVLLLSLIEFEQGAWATFTMLVALLLLQWLGDVKVFSYLYHHPLVSLKYFGYYLACGAVYAVVKWYLFVTDHKDRYKDVKDKFLKDRGVEDGVMTQELKEALQEKISDLHIEVKTQVTNHKSRITMWMTYWPWSLLWTIVDDFVKRLFKEIYRWIQSTLQRISDHVWKDVADDLPENRAPRRRTHY